MLIPLAYGSIKAADSDERFPLTGFLIRTDETNVLVNTGVGSGNEEIDRRFAPERADLPALLEEAAGLSVDDIDIVVNTHLTFDMCGNNPLFHRPPVFVQAEEYDAAMQGGNTVLDWFNPMVVHYQQLNGNYQLTDTIRVVATPGHTAGHQSLLIDDDGENILIAGSAIRDRAEYEQQRNQVAPRRGVADEAAYVMSVKRLLELDAKTVWFCHDREPWRAP